MLYIDTALPLKVINPRAKYHKYGAIAGYKFNRPYSILVPPELGGPGARLASGFHLQLTLSDYQNRQDLRLKPALDDQLYLILTSRLTKGDSTYIGNIRVPRSQKVDIIARAKALPDTGRWETLVIRAQVGEFYYINWNNPSGSEGTDSFYYVAELDQVYSCPQLGIPGLCEMLQLKPPFLVRDDPNPRIARLNYREWRKL